ncbi:MAG: hypothetical protein GKS05_11185 [Nitrospirales bacterium]|nr:hypothetical protein [Nitrospirales bacterium]
MRKSFLAILIVVGWVSLSIAPPAQSGPVLKDGMLPFPTNYTSFPPFLKDIQKPNAVRDIYINAIGTSAQQGEQFANESILVMAIYNAQKDENGNFKKDHHGNLIKADLAKIYIMQKGKNWGNHAPSTLKNGDWIYSAFKPNGDRLEVEYTKCRSCHMPLGNAKDYVHRYDEYFAKRDHHAH